jgi:hypothetical protein
MRLVRLATAALCCAFTSACSSTPTPVDQMLARAVFTAGQLHEHELDAEAALFLDVVDVVDPAYPGLLEIDTDLDPAVRERMRPSVLGMNRRLRPAAGRSFGTQALLYLPDRVLDLMDVVTFGVHFGYGVFADLHATRAAQAVGGIHSVGGLGLHEQRSLGIKSQSELALALVAAGGNSFASGTIGTSGVRGAADGIVGLHKPSMPAYQRVRDYWGIGGSATAGLAGAELELHPVQLVDFLAGWVGIDFLHDDWARTRSLRLDRSQELLLSELWRLRGADDRIAEYQRTRGPIDGWQAPASPAEE